MQYIGHDFEGDARDELMVIARSMTNPLFRARTMSIFLPDTDTDSIKRDIVTYLSTITEQTRGQVVSLFARREILSPNLWGQEIVDKTIEVILEQCRI